MRLKDRFRAASRAFRGKSADEDRQAWRQLRDFLGLDSVDDKAQSEATYFACLKVLSESVAKLPIRIQQYTPDHGVRVAREHPYYRMLHEKPNRFMTASVFWGWAEHMRDDQGNSYAWIETPKNGPAQIWPLDPRHVTVYYDDAKALKDQPDIYYYYSTPNGSVTLGSEEVLHFKSHSTTKNGLVGVSVREQLASTIQGNVKAQKMLNRMTDSGMTAKAVLQYTGSLNDANVQILKEQIEGYMKGDISARDAKNVIPIPYGFNLTPLNMKLADSQFLELRQYSALQIASAFGVKPYQVGDYTKSSYASAEAQQLSFLVDTLLYIVKQYEEEIEAKLLTDAEIAAGYHVKFDTSVLLRTEFQTMINTLGAAVSNFLMTPNEARERLDLPHKEGGDNLLGNGASIPVQYAGAQYTNTAREEDKAWITKTITEAIQQATSR